MNLSDTSFDLLIKLLCQNKGKLSKGKRQKDFDELSDKEISTSAPDNVIDFLRRGSFFSIIVCRASRIYVISAIRFSDAVFVPYPNPQIRRKFLHPIF